MRALSGDEMGVKFNLEPVKEKRVSQTMSEPEKDEGGDCEDYSERNQRLQALYSRLWTAADELRANSRLKSTEYSTPILGLLFLRYADYRFGLVEEKLEERKGGGRRSVGKADYQAEGVVYLTPEARFQFLLDLPEGVNVGRSIDNAMRDIERENEELRDVLPKVYEGMERRVLVSLLRIFNFDMSGYDGDVFGKIYEFFLGKFAMAEGQRAGEFFTPTSIVKLIVNVIEPYHGRILDPACGSGGMFVQSAEFVREHRRNPSHEIMIYGQERVDDTVRLCKMNLAVHGLSGDIRQGNTYYEDVHDRLGLFDFVMANPPFNVNNVDKEAIKGDPRYLLGIPSLDNANYLWIQVFYSMLNENGRAGFVMANSANDAGYSELEIRKQLIKQNVIDVIISISSNFFYTVTLPVTLWFLDNNKLKETNEKVLFIDARDIYRQVDRAHRDLTDQQIEFISNIVRLYRGQKPETIKCSSEMTIEHFPNLTYHDIKGLCKVITIKEIEEQGWSLNAGRYVGVDLKNINDINFKNFIISSLITLKKLNEESREIETKILETLKKLSDLNEI